MTLFTHLVAADVRRHRWLLAAWLAIVAAATLVDGTRPLLAAQPSADNPLILIDGLLGIAWVLLRVLVVVQVIHTHAVVGSTAFWLTRPIPPLLLVRAKAFLLVSALVVVPVAAEAVLMAAYGVRVGEMLRVATETAVFATLWVALLAAPAALTRSFSRFTVVSCGLLAAVALYVAIGVTVSSMAPPSEAAEPQTWGAVDYSGLFVFLVGLTAACVVVVVTQYRWRRSSRSVFAAVTGVVLVPFVAGAWPWPVLRAELELPAWAAGPSLRLSVDRAAARTSPMTRNDDPGWRNTVAPITVDGLAPGWSAETALLGATLQIGDRTLTSVPAPFPTPAAAGAARLARSVVIERLVGAGRLVAQFPPTPPANQLLILRDAELGNDRTASGRYHGRHYVRLVHHTVEVMVPLRPGARAASGSYHLAVATVMVSGGGVQIRVRQSDATSRFDRRTPREREFFVVNRRTGVAYGLGQGQSPVGLLPRMFNGVSVGGGDSAGFDAQILDLRFPPEWQGAADEPISRDWLERAELVVVTSSREGGIELTLDDPPQ